MYKERLQEAQNILNELQVDYYLLPMADFHKSEYLSDYFKSIAYLTGFTGSAGTLVIGKEEICLWVDGRYFIQADNQSAIHGIKIMKMGLPETPTVKEYLSNNIDAVIGFDGRLLSVSTIEDLPHTNLKSDIFILDTLWTTRPELSKKPGFSYDTKYCGVGRIEKFEQVRKCMEDNNFHIMTTLDDIAWTFNIRGKDVACNPTILSYALFSTTNINLYVQDGSLDESTIQELNNDGVNVKSYDDIYEDVKSITDTVLLDKNTVNYAIFNNISKDVTITNKDNPTQLLKAIKNDVEIKNTINAHIKDGVAMTKYMYYLKNELVESDEVELANYIDKLRSEQDAFYDISFDTICGYQENAALMHYHAIPENCSIVKKEGLLLVDSGGQYLDGTTDITRTFALGDITSEQRRDFTIVLKAMLRLSDAVFLKGFNGQQLDILARGVVYQYGLDYRCGTGHGVGHFLGVHEGPQGIHSRVRPGLSEGAPIVPGMITTNEPGIYKEGKHGIRLENELLCVIKEENEYGQFLEFKTITYCPIDVDAIDYSMMSNHEIETLQNYHQEVYDTISPYLTTDEKTWLYNFINK